MIRNTIYQRFLLLAALPALMLASCSQEEMGGEQDTQNGAIRFEIGFAPQTDPHTRVATDTQFNSTWEEGDEIGVFAVKHGTALAASGNPLHNIKLTYNAQSKTWSGPAYWPTVASNITALDFYAYYPYDAAATDPTAIMFDVQADQNATTGAKSNYNLSDLLMAKADNSGSGFGKGETIQLSFKHALAMVQVNVSKSMIGDYTDALTVWLNGCTTDCVLNLSGQSTTQPGNLIPSTTQITMYPCPNDGDDPGIYAYRALVPEQTIASGTAMFSFNYGTGTVLLRSNPINSSLLLTAGKAETFDMTFPFTSATVSSTVRLASLFTDDELSKITHLKVLGEMIAADFTTIKEKMPLITNVDLGGATVVGNAIPNEAFRSKTSLKEFVFPRDIKAIGSYAFYGCSGFTGDLVIPDEVTTIGEYAFAGCSGFDGTLTLSKKLTTIGNNAFFFCSKLTGGLVIPNEVTTIGDNAFNGCSGFEGTLTLSKKLTTIGTSAFRGCSGFTGDLVIPDEVTTIGNAAFNGCSGFEGTLTLSKKLTTIGTFAFDGCSGFTGDLVIPNEVTTIGNDAFSGCSGFEGTLTLSQKLTTIGNDAFEGCSGFTGDLVIPDEVTTIGNDAFSGCSGFKGTLTLSKKLTTIGTFAFDGCSGFTGDLVIPNEVTTIGNDAFSGCSGFEGTLTLSQKLTTIGNDAFDGCSGFTGDLVIPDEVTTIGNYAFYLCRGFTGGLVIPNEVTTIGTSAFSNCSGFTGSLTIPQSITTIGDYAFYYCSNLTSITCHIQNPGTVTTGSQIFSGVLTSIPLYVPNGTEDDYRKTSPWSNFNSIQPITP